MFRGWKRPEKGFFDEMERQFEEMDKLMTQMMQSMGREPLVYGFSLQVGPDGVPHIERFGNVRPMDVSGSGNVREPFTSSILDDKNNELKITAEMPGIRKEEIQVNAAEDEITIKADGERKYYKNLKTPSLIDPESASAKYNNGVLEVTFKLKEPVKQKGRTIKIE
jgi:HSP20 family protein